MAITTLSELEQEIERINNLPPEEKRQAQEELRDRREALSLEAQAFMASYAVFYEKTMTPVVNEVLREFRAEVKKELTASVSRSVKPVRLNKTKFKKKLSKAIDDSGVLENQEDFISGKISESFSVGTGEPSLKLPKTQEQNLTRSRWAPGNKTAIQRLRGSRQQVKDDIVNEISGAVERGDLIRENSRKLLGDITNPRIPIGNVTGDNLNKKLEVIVKDFKRLGKVDPALQRKINAFRKTVAKMDVRGLQKTGTVTNRLKKAYSGVLDAVEAGVGKSVDEAVKNAVLQKGRYLSDRISRTEIARARFEGFVWRMQQDPDIGAMKLHLSDAHPEKDECNFFTSVNFGLGRGVYPKTKVPPFPIHPNCLCYFTEIFVDEIEGKTFEDSEEAGRRELDTFSKKERQRLFTIEGESSYQKGGDWRKLGSKWWDGVERPDVSI